MNCLKEFVRLDGNNWNAPSTPAQRLAADALRRAGELQADANTSAFLGSRLPADRSVMSAGTGFAMLQKLAEWCRAKQPRSDDSKPAKASATLTVSLPLVFQAAAKYAIAMWDHRPRVLGNDRDSFDFVPGHCGAVDVACFHLAETLQRPKFTEPAWHDALAAMKASALTREALRKFYTAINWERERLNDGQRQPASLREAFTHLNDGLHELIQELDSEERIKLQLVIEEIEKRWGWTVPSERTPTEVPMKTPVDFLIVTALEEERDAVLSKLPGYTTPPPSEDDVRRYYSAPVDATFSDGSTSVYKVALVSLAGMGRVQAATTTSDAIRYWHPRYVMLVGIAGGLKSSGVALGDILIADQIVDYELQKVTPWGPEIRWKAHPVDPRLLEFALSFPTDSWHKLVRETRPKKGEPARRKGTVATGDKVLAVEILLESYKKQSWAKLIGVEMEAGGGGPDGAPVQHPARVLHGEVRFGPS
jgi:nucleoside phosphorylase